MTNDSFSALAAELLLQHKTMENITTGHWIFAGVFALGFIGFLIWSYTKDLPMHRRYYRGASFFLLFFLLAFFLMFIFKRLL